MAKPTVMPASARRRHWRASTRCRGPAPGIATAASARGPPRRRKSSGFGKSDCQPGGKGKHGDQEKARQNDPPSSRGVRVGSTCHRGRNRVVLAIVTRSAFAAASTAAIAPDAMSAVSDREGR